MKRYWFEASRSDLIARVAALESELAVASALLGNLNDRAEHRSTIATELQRKWRDLLAEQPAVEEVVA